MTGRALSVVDLVTAVETARDADTCVADVGADLLASGEVSLAELGRALGITRQSVTERVQTVPSWREVNRAWHRVSAWLGLAEDGGRMPVRVSVAGRFVVFDQQRQVTERADQAPTSWRVLRHTPQPADALQLAAYLAREDAETFRFVRAPRDLDTDNVLPWRLP